MRLARDTAGSLVRRYSIALCVMICASLAGANGTELSPSLDSDGYKIYAKAITTWAAMTEPPYLTYHVVARARHHGRIRRDDDLNVLFRSADRTGVSQNRINPAASNATTFGRPRYLPDAAFRLVPRVAGNFDANLEASPAPETTSRPLRTIGGIVAQARRYTVDLIGEEPYRDRHVYHLRLTPLFNPQTNSVREMWVDTETFVTWKLVDEAYIAVGPARGRFLLNVDYAPIGRAWLIERVTTSGALRFGFIAYGGDAEVVFSQIAAPQQIPAACFQAETYVLHRAECETAFPSKSLEFPTPRR